MGGDLVQGLGGRGRRIIAEKFLFAVPPNFEFFFFWGGTAGESLSLGTNVGSCRTLHMVPYNTMCT